MAAAVFAMRLPAQLGHTVRDLHEKATSRSWPQESQWQRENPPDDATVLEPVKDAFGAAASPRLLRSLRSLAILDLLCARWPRGGAFARDASGKEACDAQGV